MLSVERILTEPQFLLFRDLIHRESGIWLGELKQALVAGRLSRRLRALGIDSFEEYYERATGDAVELVQMLNAIATNETQFFRERPQFELLAERLCPEWEAEAAAGNRPRHLRIWSAACSSGEEPYSIAMLLHDRLGPLGWSVEVLATDLSTKVLERAKAAVWPEAKATGIPPEYLRRFALRGTGPEEGRVKIGCEIRNMVRFGRLNLQDESYRVPAPFDAIFCRNVLIYFDSPSRQAVVSRLIERIAPGGYLFLGHAESLMGRNTRVTAVRPAVYRVQDA
jgi:chemotaxis protein methyltransferase CheR